MPAKPTPTTSTAAAAPAEPLQPAARAGRTLCRRRNLGASTRDRRPFDLSALGRSLREGSVEAGGDVRRHRPVGRALGGEGRRDVEKVGPHVRARRAPGQMGVDAHRLGCGQTPGEKIRDPVRGRVFGLTHCWLPGSWGGGFADVSVGSFAPGGAVDAEGWTLPGASRFLRYWLSSGASRVRPRAHRLFTVPGAQSTMAATSSTRVALHVDEDERDPLLLAELGERLHHIRTTLAGLRGVVLRLAARDRAEPVLVLGERLRGSALVSAQPVEAGVDDDPVQPGRDLSVPSEAVGAVERREQRVLEGVGSLLAVTRRADRHRPEAVAVPADELGERVRVAGDMGAQQRTVVGVGCHPRTWISATFPWYPPVTGGTDVSQTSRNRVVTGLSSAMVALVPTPDAVPTRA